MGEAPQFFTSDIHNLQQTNGRQDDVLEIAQIGMEVSVPAGEAINTRWLIPTCQACLAITCDVRDKLKAKKVGNPSRVGTRDVYRINGRTSAPVGILQDGVRPCK